MEAKSKFIEEADVLMGQLFDLSKKHKENGSEVGLMVFIAEDYDDHTEAAGVVTGDGDALKAVFVDWLMQNIEQNLSWIESVVLEAQKRQSQKVLSVLGNVDKTVN